MKRKVISVLLALCMVMTILIPAAKASLESDKNDLQNKVDEAKDQKDQVASEKKDTMSEISELEESIAKYEVELDKLSEEISELEETIESQTQEIENLQKEYDRMQQLLTDRLVAIYEEGQPTFLDILLSSNSISDYISGTTMIEQLAEADNKQMDEVEEQRKAVEKAKREMEEQKTKLDTAKKSADAKQKQLRVMKTSKETKVANLTAEEKKIQKQIEEYQADIIAIEKKIREEAQNASGIYNGSFSGTLGWPISSSSRNYNIVSSKFGPRNSPVAGASSNHRGIDIPVSTGTPVYAAADGYVVSVQQTSARGLFILVKHADDLYTRYQHLSSNSVSTGQYVKRAQVIARSGNTGIGSGPHLHFEVLRTPYYMTEIDPLNCGLLSKPSNLVIW